MTGLRMPLSRWQNNQWMWCRLAWAIMNTLTDLTPERLRNAAEIQEQIQDLQNELNKVLGRGPSHAGAVPGRRRRLSAEGLANIRAGAKKRWAAFHIEHRVRGVPGKRKARMSA